MSELTNAELAAELALLRLYNLIRIARGHDFGCGQRYAELSRRQRRLEELCRTGPSAYELERDVDAVALAGAWERVGRPRLNRALRENYRWHTAGTRRTIGAWRDLEARVKAHATKPVTA